MRKAMTASSIEETTLSESIRTANVNNAPVKAISVCKISLMGAHFHVWRK